MLVLSRKENESIVVKLPNGQKIIVKVQRITGNVVRLGIEAPKDIAIVRQELLET